MKKGQITLYLLLGVIALGLFVAYSGKTPLSISMADDETTIAVKAYSQSCLESSAKFAAEGMLFAYKTDFVILDDTGVVRYVPILFDKGARFVDIGGSVNHLLGQEMKRCMENAKGINSVRNVEIGGTSVELLSNSTMFRCSQTVTADTAGGQTNIDASTSSLFNYRILTMVDVMDKILAHLAVDDKTVPLRVMIDESLSNDLEITYRYVIEENPNGRLIVFKIQDKNYRLDFGVRAP